MADTYVLPESLEENTIGNMSIGDEAYTTPWAMWVDLERRMWAHPGYPAKRSPWGTVSMKIKREVNALVVYKSTIGDYRYSPTAQPGYVGGVDGWIPVVLR
jgi:hypothetical protein